jgi:uncharacterized protein YecE (DUF72 family)
VRPVQQPGRVRIGTSGWIYRHWRGTFYPRDLAVTNWFAFYSRIFDTVEVNNTFYRLPEATVFQEWARQAPPGFLYALKASRFLTHMKKLQDPEASLKNILGRARQLGPHLGPVLYQLPPHWHCNPDRLATFLAALPRDLTHVVEFRDPSWYTEEVRGLLQEHGVGFCIHDMKGQVCPRWATGPLVYLRFHGPTQVAYAGRYGTDPLREWAGTIREYLDAGRDVFVYFNNDDRAFAVADARELRQLLSREHVLVGGR